VSASDISGGVGDGGQASGDSTAEPVRCESLVAEDRTHGVGRKLGGGAVCEEFEDEPDLREGGEDTSDMEFELRFMLSVTSN
jgi:hypothetical protein